MTAHDEEAAVRGHGPRAVCDHGSVGVDVRAHWCANCGALRVDGEWQLPRLLAQAVDERDAARARLTRERDLAVRDRDTMCATLTIAQQRGTDLVEELRALKAASPLRGVTRDAVYALARRLVDRLVDGNWTFRRPDLTDLDRARAVEILAEDICR